MPELRFVLAGAVADDAAKALIASLDGGDGIAAKTFPRTALPETQRRVIDPIALATLIVSIPAGVLAAWDLVARIRNKRPKAQAVVQTAQRLRIEQQVEVYLLAADETPWAVADLNADTLLDLVAGIASEER